ncbi:unnamed protein product [Closterium sp. Naga37s-1]|nr:unnamed protein product [Closterium sp. Naga37s-1]
MANKGEKSVVDQGQTVESVLAPPPAPPVAPAVAPVAPAAPPAAPPAAVAASANFMPPAAAVPLSQSHEVSASGATLPAAQPTKVPLQQDQAAVAGPVLGTAVGCRPWFCSQFDPRGRAWRRCGGSSGIASGSRFSPSYRSAPRGGRGGWWGGRGRGRGEMNEMQQLRANFPRKLAAAMRAALAGAPNTDGAQAPAHAASVPTVPERGPPPPTAAQAPQTQPYAHFPAPAVVHAPPAATRPVSAAPYPDLPWIPAVAGMGFVGAGGGEARGQFIPRRRLADVPVAPPPPSLPVVPTATLGQLWYLVKCQQSLTLILVNAHFAILQSPGSTLNPCERAECLTAASQSVVLLLPVLAPPATGDVVVSQLDETVQGLTGHLRGGGGIEVAAHTSAGGSALTISATK